MTIPYGATAYGMGNQMIEDAKKSGIPLLTDLEHSWGAYLGRLNYETARNCIKNPMRMLEIFEIAGKRADKQNKYLQWEMPISRFPVIQYYVEGTVKKTNIRYRGRTLQLNLCYTEDLSFAKGRQSCGVAPNVVHSFDALHVCLVTNYAPFEVTTVHDSFGSLLGDMDALYKLVRKTFVEIYETTDMNEFMQQIGVNDLEVPKGTLDLNSIHKSEYAFL
jgi:DNA-directed RNA polymerase